MKADFKLPANQGLTVEDILKTNIVVVLCAMAACDDVLVPNSLIQGLRARRRILGSYRYGDGITLWRRHFRVLRWYLVRVVLVCPFFAFCIEYVWLTHRIEYDCFEDAHKAVAGLARQPDIRTSRLVYSLSLVLESQVCL